MEHDSRRVQAQSLPEVIYRDLVDGILSGDYRPGQVLRQEELADAYGVSRGPVREALNRLTAEGVIEARPRRGYAVTSLDPEEIRELFELRSVIEEHAGAIAARFRGPDDIAAVKQLLAQMRALDSAQPDQRRQWLDLNRQFHARVFRSSGREHLCRMCTMLRDMVEPYIRLEVAVTGDLEDAQQDHEAIFAAFRKGDEAEVARLSRKHCEKTAARLLHGLSRTTTSAPVNA